MSVGGTTARKLVAENIRVHFEGVKAVDGVDLELEHGMVMGLIGPNGAGKTTFMNAVSHFVHRTTGRVILDGEDVTKLQPHRLAAKGLIRTFQDVATFPDLSVFENIELGALASGLSRRKARQRAWELIQSLEISHLATFPASALPHGDERIVGIARAVAASPKYLLLDEPAAGLDDAESLQLAETIAKIRDDLGCGVLLVEHDMRIIFKICERIQVLDFGKPLAVGTADEVKQNPDVIAAYLGVKGAEAAKEHQGA